MSTISKTLLNSLFFNTESVLPQQEIYSYVKERIFPNAKEYINFLQLSDMTEKREVAKKIIKRLCMCSNYQPPYEIIINISEQETNKKNQSINKNYIPQDHFVHIVNTYIFGVYIYFWHPSFMRELNLSFSEKRKGDNYLKKINTINDFISSWKSFCLYHDIGYPFEIYYGKGSTLTKDELEEMRDLNDIFKHLKDHLTVKALAKLVVINSIIKEAKNNRDFRDTMSILCYKFDPVMCSKPQLNNNNMSFVNDYYELEDIYSFENFKMFLGFIQQEDIMKVLFYSVLGQPIAFSYMDKGELVIYKNAEISLPITDDKIKSILSNNETPFDSNIELKYYIKNSLSLFEDKIKNRIDDNDLDNILEYVKEEKNIPLDLKHVNSEADLENLIFEIYEGITKILKRHLENFHKKGIGHIDIKDKKVRENITFINRETTYKDYVNNKISGEINDFLASEFKKQSSEMDKLTKVLSSIEDPTRRNILKPVSDYIDVFFSKKGSNNITEHIVNKIISTLQVKIARVNSLIESYATIACIFESNCNENKAEQFISESGIDIKKLLKAARKNPRIDEEYNEIDKKIFSKRYVSVEKLIEKYEGEFTKYDHGICSGVIYLYVNSISSFFAEKINNGDDAFEKMLIPLFWAIDPKLLPQKLLTNYEHIHEKTFSAIFCHNINSKTANEEFNLNDEKKWITKIDKDAFLYFCMLCDSLQHWEREKYYDPRIIDYNPLFAMDSYNISIKNDKIIIKTLTNTDNYDDILKKFNYDDFLEDCSRYLLFEINAK